MTSKLSSKSVLLVFIINVILCSLLAYSFQKILDMLFNEEWRRPPPRYVMNPPTAEESSGEVFPQATKSSSNLAKGIEIIASTLMLS